MTPMAHKTITISEEAYQALARLKGEKESFTDIILKISKKKVEGTLLNYIRGLKPDDELVDTLEQILKERQELQVPTPRL